MLLDDSQNPYRGLQAFEEEHSKLFFGRQTVTEKLYQKVCEQTLTVLLGPSGAGKSSLVRAGLIPHLKKLTPKKSNSLEMLHGKSLRNKWYIIAPIRPGESPLKALNSALAREKILPSREQKIKHVAINIGTWLQENIESKLLLVIDRAEELLTMCPNEQEREDFLRLLADLIDNYSDKLRIVLTLRSDFEQHFQNAALKEYWHDARFIVPRMTRSELRSCIEKPASAREINFESSSLVEKLIDEVLEIPEGLPLLSFTLKELYLKCLKAVKEGTRKDWIITQEDYEQLGGVKRSLNRRGDNEYDALVKLGKVYKRTIRDVMLRMLVANRGKVARRRILLSELEYPEDEDTRVKRVIRRFTDAGLLVQGRDNEDNPYVEPAHDTFVWGWQRLVLWEEDEEETVHLQRWLRPAVMKWKSQQKSKFLWDSHPLLESLKNVLNSDDNWLNPIEAEFVRRSIRHKNRNKILHRVFAVGGGVLAVGTAFFVRFSHHDKLIAQACKLVDDYLPYNPDFKENDKSGEYSFMYSHLCEDVPVFIASPISSTTSPATSTISSIPSPTTSPISSTPSPTVSSISSIPAPTTSPISSTPSPTVSSISNIPSPATSPLTAKKFLPSLQTTPKDYYSRGREQNDIKSIQNSTKIINNPNASNVEKKNAYINRGVIYFRDRKYQQAIADYTKVIKDWDRDTKADIAPTKSQLVNAYVNRGIAYSSLQEPQHQLAIKDYDRAIAIHPDYADAYINRGIAYSGLSNHEMAIQNYTQAIGIAPENADIYYAKAFTQSLMEGNKQEAVENYEKAADLYQQQGKPSYSKNAQKKIEELKALSDE